MFAYLFYLTKACFSEGSTIETRMRKEKKKFIRIEMLVVRPEYQNKIWMKNDYERVKLLYKAIWKP